MTEQTNENGRGFLHDDIRNQILELIQKDALSPGDQLPSERNLAEQFNVSRNSIREALRALAEQKVVQSRRGHGTFVRSVEGVSNEDELSTIVMQRRKRIREIFEFRKILEPQIAFLAASCITQQDIDRLKMLVFDQERNLISGDDDVELDAEFHLVLARATKNTIITKIFKTLQNILRETRSSFFQSEERRRASLRTHVLIVDALEKKLPDEARNAMNRHLEEIEAVVSRDDSGLAGEEKKRDPGG